MNDDTRQTARRSAGPMRVEVTRSAIARVGASPILAIDPSIIGRGVMLEPPRPNATLAAYVTEESADSDGSKGNKAARLATAAHMTIRGPLAQRASWEMCGGYIDGYDAIVDRFAAAHSNVEVDAVIVDIDSCGGDVAGLEQCVAKMLQINERSGKPVFFYVNESAYSAAYWIAAAINTKGISLPEAAGVGSIGVIGGWVDETGALEQEGVAVHLIRYPEGKAESNSLAPIADLADARLSVRIETTGKRFIAAMASARKLKADAVLAFNGDTFSGEAAVNAKLADRVETFESLVARAQTAGRQWRRSTEKAMADENRLVNLEAFEKNVLTITGSKDQAAALGAITAAKEVAANAPNEAAKLAAAEENLRTLSKRQDDSEAAQAIGAAKAEGKIVPANEAKAHAFYATYGLEPLKGYLDGLVRVTPAAAAPAEPRVVAGTLPAHLPVDAPVSAQIAPKAYEQMRPVERAAFAQRNGTEAYKALKQDWIDRGRPATV